MSETRKVRMLKSLSGEDTFNSGDSYDVPAAIAVAWCSEPEGDPRAEPVGWSLDDAEQRTTATAPTAAKAQTRRKKQPKVETPAEPAPDAGSEESASSDSDESPAESTSSDKSSEPADS